ncbi:Wzz/FepE/Etk N-terminal domain-containing protein [Kribbella sp. CA-294648]|uniref:Wzz/FepE/Etk N-terminal domain-containing protein n=1 Tax=Kribbella sp. CA-294648 TaxID=3239948 RepID=UPI003D9045AC
MGSSTTHVPATDGFADYLGMVRRGWPVIAIGAVLGLLGAFGYLQLQQGQYTSVASVLVTPTGVQNTADLANGRTNSEINLDTEARLVRSTEVATKSRELMKSSGEPGDLAAAVAVAVPPNTEVLSISFTAVTPAEAQQGAHAFAQAYLSSRAASAQASLDAQMTAIKNQQTLTLRSLRTVVETLAKLPNGSAERAYYSAQRDLLTQQLQGLNQLMGKLTTTVVTPGRVLNDAELPGRSAGPAAWTILVAGLCLGLLLGLAVAALRMRTDRRVRSASEVEQLFALPVVGEPGALDRLVPAAVGTTTFEAFRRVSNALPKKQGSAPVTVLVTGATETTAPAAVAVNLALTLHSSGQRVLLISTDHDDNTLSQMMGAPHARPLAELLAVVDPAAAEPTVVREDPALAIVSPGVPSSGASAALLGLRGGGLLRALGNGYDYVIIAVAATSTSADAQSLAGLADAVLLVAELKLTTRAQLEDARHQFEEIGKPVHGVVLVRRGRKQRSNGAAPAVVASPATSVETDPVESEVPKPAGEQAIEPAAGQAEDQVTEPLEGPFREPFSERITEQIAVPDDFDKNVDEVPQPEAQSANGHQPQGAGDGSDDDDADGRGNSPDASVVARRG